MTATASPPRAATTPDVARRWRQWRLPLMIIGIMVTGGIVVALLTPTRQSNSYLDPASHSSDGAHALTDIISERGYQVISAYSPARALAAIGKSGAGPSSSGPSATTLVITSPDLLTASQLARLSRAHADLVLIEPGAASLRALAPGVLVQNPSGPSEGGTVPPGCGLAAARLAGPVYVAGYTYTVPAGATACYRLRGHPSLVTYAAAGRTVTILGSGLPLTNGLLARHGHAALALNLLAGRHRIVWLTPQPTVLPGGSVPGPVNSGPRAAPSLIPEPVSLLLLELAVAALLAAAWRARRFGPLISERLPVVVRACETVEGHARLYQSRRARGRAAASLRDATAARLVPMLGLAKDAPPRAISGALAGRSRRGLPQIDQLLYGPPPESDAELVDLARNLDDLEREVRSQ